MKKTLLPILLSALLAANISSCNLDSKSKIEESLENTDTPGSNIEQTDEKTTESEYDPTTHMRYTLNDDGMSYSVCPAELPEVIKELVIPGEYKGLPVTEIKGKFFEHSIETIIISEGIKEISMSFSYRCSGLKNIYIPDSVIYIAEGAFNCRATMGGDGFIKSNVIEKIVVAEGNPCYYVDGNCLIERSSKKIILGCNSSVIPNDGSVKSIGYAAFANCHAVETVVLPKSIMELEYAAFDNCDSLKQVYLTSSASKDQKIVNFDTETVFGHCPDLILYVPDAESLEIYSKVFGSYTRFEIGTPS